MLNWKSAKFATTLLLMFHSMDVYAAQTGWYVAFSGESTQPINTIYKLSTTGSVLGEVFSSSLGFHELRNMSFGPDQKLYVTNSNKKDSRVIVFGKVNPDGITRDYLGDYVTPKTSSGLVHPYYLTFDSTGDLYISVQDTDVVLGVYGPDSRYAGTVKPLSAFLQEKYPKGKFAAGTFVPAYTAKIKPETSVSAKKGGLTGNKTQSVRAFAFGPQNTLYVADEGNNRVSVFDSETGYLLKTISNKHTLHPDQLFYHAVDNLLFIACPGAHRIIFYNAKTGKLKTFINDADRLKHVSGIAFGADNNFYAADREKKVIYQYDSDGKFQKIFAGPFTDSPEGIMPLFD